MKIKIFTFKIIYKKNTNYIICKENDLKNKIMYDSLKATHN